LKARRNYLYAVLAVAAAVVYGVAEGAYWVTDVVVLAVVAVAVGILCLAKRRVDPVVEILTFGVSAHYGARGAKTAAAELNQRERIPRSRIAHYVALSRIKSTAAIAKQFDTPFERALLSQPEWRTLSGGGLEEITRKATDASAESTQ
jgi:hypothetical protein